MTSSFTTFGQELYQDVSIQAIEQFHTIKDHDLLLESISDILPHPSEKTRRRLAEKLVQRHFNGLESGSHSIPYLRLVANLSDTREKNDLIYWRTASTDKVISAIASEIFYPFFILNTIPDGYSDETFNMINTGSLFSMDRIITTDLVINYARTIWDFTSAKSIRLALRIMRQAELIDSMNTRKGRKNILGYYPNPHNISASVFAFCLYEELLISKSTPTPSLDQVHNSDAVKVFFMSRPQVDSMLRTLEKKGIVELMNQHGGRYVHLKLPDMDALVKTLIENQHRRGR
ncbi:MAG: hypothetical protein ACYC0V_19915 [Armatimonadota bacterium]